MNDEIDEMDPRLALMMQWLKDNDESEVQVNEHRNNHNVYALEGTDSN